MTETPKCIHNGAPCCRCMPNGPCTAPWPTEKTPVEAFSAALHRAEPEMRPLTLGEIWEAVDDEDWNFVWLEYNLSSYTLQIIPQHTSKTYFYFLVTGVDEGGRKEPIVEINKEWRCWLRKPTRDQMAAEKWEE